MRVERARLLSNLIAAFIDDFQPHVPLHAWNAAYPPPEQYTAALPLVDSLTPRPDYEESEDEGATIAHWRAGGVEIDPLFANDSALDTRSVDSDPTEEPNANVGISNLSQADSKAFRANAELPDNRDEIAAEILQNCEMRRGIIDSFTASHNATAMDGGLIDAFLSMLLQLRKEAAAIVRTTYTSTYHFASNTRDHLRSSSFTRGNIEDSQFVLIPIRKHCDAQCGHADKEVHYILGLYNRSSGTLFHFDSLGTRAIQEDKIHYRHAVQTLSPNRHYKCKRVVNRPAAYYNHQSDVRLSGFYILITAELLLLRGFDRTYLKRLGNPRFAITESQDQVHRVTSLLRSLDNGVFPCYRAPPKSQQQAPEVRYIDAYMDSRRMFIFEGNNRPQIVEDPPEELTPIGRCADRHPHYGCFAMHLNHKIDPFVPSTFTRKCPHCDAWLTEYEFHRGSLGGGNGVSCKFCRDGRIATEEMMRIVADYQRVPREFVDLRDPQTAQAV
jgi:hypothetical protein